MLRIVPVWLLLSAQVYAGTIFTPGGDINGIVADPVGPLFYLSLSTGEIVAVDSRTGTEFGRSSAQGVPGSMAILPNGAALLVMLIDSRRVRILDLPGLTDAAPIALTSTDSGDCSLEIGRPGRAYAACADGLGVIDTANITELSLEQPPGVTFSSMDSAISSDFNTMYLLDKGVSPYSVFVVDVSTDTPTYAGEDCCHACAGNNGEQIELSPDGRQLYLASGSPYYLQVLSSTSLLHEEAAVLVGPFPNAVVPAPDGSRVYIGYGDSYVAAADTATWLPFREEPLSGAIIAHGLVVSADGTRVGAVVEDASFNPARLEIVDTASLSPTLGGVKARPIDATMNQEVPGAAISLSAPAQRGMVHRLTNTLGAALASPGSPTATVSAPGYQTQNFPVTVTAGAWTDVGNLLMTATTTQRSNPGGLCVAPALIIGTTMDAQLFGSGFLDGLSVAISSSDVVLNSFSYRGAAVVDINVTVSPSAPAGLQSYIVRVTNPDGEFEDGNLVILPPPFVIPNPPNPTGALLAARSNVDVRLYWDDSVVDAMHAAASDYRLYRSVTARDAGYASIALIPNSPASQETYTDAGAIGSGAPFSALHFYRTAAFNAEGDSGDIPTP